LYGFLLRLSHSVPHSEYFLDLFGIDSFISLSIQLMTDLPAVSRRFEGSNIKYEPKYWGHLSSLPSEWN